MTVNVQTPVLQTPFNQEPKHQRLNVPTRHEPTPSRTLPHPKPIPSPRRILHETAGSQRGISQQLIRRVAPEPGIHRHPLHLRALAPQEAFIRVQAYIDSA